jgi:hypothetical protein
MIVIFVYSKMPFNSMKDFPVALIASVPLVLVINNIVAGEGSKTSGMAEASQAQ